MPKILIVEDDKHIAMALSVRLKSQGFETLIAADALAGVGAAVNEAPDLVLLDITMPAGGGFSVAQHAGDRSDAGHFFDGQQKPRNPSESHDLSPGGSV